MYAHLLSSINRNIVECKEYTKREQQELLEVLIETLWNVKRQIQTSRGGKWTVLIETLWNVKWFINSNVVI